MIARGGGENNLTSAPTGDYTSFCAVPPRVGEPAGTGLCAEGGTRAMPLLEMILAAAALVISIATSIAVFMILVSIRRQRGT